MLDLVGNPNCWFLLCTGSIYLCISVGICLSLYGTSGAGFLLIDIITWFVTMVIKLSCKCLKWLRLYEPRQEKTGLLPMRKQRRRSASHYCEADQRLCFRYTDNKIPLLPIPNFSRF